MGPKIGNLIEYVRNSGKVIYARIIGIDGDGKNRIFVCQTPRGNRLYLERFDFRVVKTMAGSTQESFNRIFKG